MYLQSSSDESDDLGTANREASAAAAAAAEEAQKAAREKENSAKGYASARREEPRTEVIAGKKVLIAQTPKGIRRYVVVFPQIS